MRRLFDHSTCANKGPWITSNANDVVDDNNVDTAASVDTGFSVGKNAITRIYR